MYSQLPAAQPALSLADFTSTDLMVPQLRGLHAASAIRELCAVLQRAAGVPDLLPFYQAALNREFLFGVTMGYGLAFTHARVSGLARLSFALGRSPEPLAWVPKGRTPVRLVFLCAVPATEATACLRLNLGLARLANEPRWFKALLEAAGAAEMMDALGQVTLRAARSADR